MILSEEREICIGGSIIFGSGVEKTLTGSEIARISIDEGADGALLPGNVLSASCRVDLVNDEGQWLSGGSMLGGQMLIGATLMLKIGVKSGGETLWRDLGVFQVENALYAEAEAVMRLNCADSISSELGAEFSDPLAYPATLAQIWHAAVSQSRYSWSGDVPNGGAVVDQKPDWNRCSLRQVMGMTAMAAGCFVMLDRSGSLQLKPLLSGRTYALSPEDYIRLERDDKSYGPLDALRIMPVGENARERVCRVGETALHVLNVENNPLFCGDAAHLDSLAQGMLNRVAGYASGKADFTWRGDPELTIGDRVLLTDLHGNSFSGVLSRQSISCDRRLQAVCACAVPDETDGGMQRAITPEGGLNAAALTGAINGALLSVGSVTANKLAAGSVTAEKLAAGAVDAEALSAVTAKIETLTASDISTDRLAAALAAFSVITAGTAEFDRATVGHLVSRALNLEFGAADEVFIKNLRVAYAQLVYAAIGNLVIKASDGNYYRIDVSPDGSITATAVAVSEDETAAGQTDAGQIILATDITAESLNTSSLLATYALVNSIDAARIDVDQLFAREAFIARLLTTDISSNTYIQQTITGEVEKFARLDEQGLHIGQKGADSELLLDQKSVSVRQNGRAYSKFASDFVQFGNYQLRRSADGGLVFKLTEG